MSKVLLPLLAATALGLLACGDDPDTTADTATDTTPDTTPDPDAGDADVSEDTSPDAAETNVCEFACLNAFGNNDKSLCPDPKSEWNCVAGCCEAVFRCEVDDDCAVKGFELNQCADNRFDCRCNAAGGAIGTSAPMPAGSCYTWLCAVDSECANGEVCAGGRCLEASVTTGLSVRILDRQTVLTPGASYQLHIEAFDPEDLDIVRPVTAVFTTSDADVATVSASGLVTAGETAGPVTITATLGTETSTIVLENVVPNPVDQLTVIVRTELTWEPLVGSYIIVDKNGAHITDDLPADGIIRVYTGNLTLVGPFDVHVLSEENDWVSWLALETGSVRYLPVPRTLYGRLEANQDNEFVPESQMRNVGIISGTPDMSSYRYEGALDLVLTSTALSSALFDFSLPVLLGSDVKRFVHPDSNIPRIDKTEPLTIPGGVVFNLAGPAIPSYVLAAPMGRHRLWSIGGRLDLNEIAEYSGAIVDAIAGGDLDFTQIVGAVFPLFRNFWSGYASGVEVTELEQPGEVVTFNQKLTTPMGFGTRLDIPELPSLGELGEPATEYWADGLFLLSGAQTVDGFMVPLGLNGGADTSNKETNAPDGFADADERTPAKDAFALPFAPLHSGLQGPHTRYSIAAVAASIPAGGGDPRPSAGSATLVRWNAGDKPVLDLALSTFLGFPEDIGSNFETRTIKVEALAAADTMRVLVKGKRGTHWTFYGVPADGSFVVPKPVDFGLAEALGDRFVRDDIDSVLVNALDFSTGTDVTKLAVPGGLQLDLLLAIVERVSFIDIKNRLYEAQPAK